MEQCLQHKAQSNTWRPFLPQGRHYHPFLQHEAQSNAWHPFLPQGRHRCPLTLLVALPKSGCSQHHNWLQADQCKPQQIANICWAFGTLGYRSAGSLMKVLCQQAELKISGFNPQNLANLWWALAR